MTMTAISKRFQRVMKLLYEYGNRQECDTELKIMRTNESKIAKTDQHNNEHLGEFDFTKNIYEIIQHIRNVFLHNIQSFIRIFRLSYGKTSKTVVIGKILAGV